MSKKKSWGGRSEAPWIQKLDGGGASAVLFPCVRRDPPGSKPFLDVERVSKVAAYPELEGLGRTR